MKIAKFILGSMQTNCYFIIDELTKSCIIVDPADDIDTIMKKLTDKELKCEKIILTHGHFDHMLALEDLREKTKAPLYIHEADNEMLLDPEKSLMSFYAGNKAPFDSADILLKDGDEIDFHGNIIKVMHTPGHTKGSCCYLVGEHMICGDTLFRGSIGRYDFYGGDYNTILSSLEKIKALETDYRIYPGHGPSSHLSYEKEYNLYMR